MARLLPLWIAAELGREEEVRPAWEALAADDFTGVLGDSYSLIAVAQLARICVALRDRQRAPVLYDLLLPHSSIGLVPIGATVWFGVTAHILGLLARTMGLWQVAKRHFSDALDITERMGARPHLAHTCREYAALLIERSRGAGITTDATHVRELLERALSLYQDLGMESFTVRTRELQADPRLSGTPDKPRAAPHAPHYTDGLSQREVEVLRLIALGKSNREVADWLVISRNTVLRHINHIFEKTGCANRTEAATYAHRHGLVE